MKKLSLATGLLAAGLVASSPAFAKPVKLWETTGLDTPESALADVKAGIIYVSNIAGVPTEKDGNGFISTLSLDGKIVKLKWATGLDAPKGMALVGDRLYVSDVDRLVAISTKDGFIVATYPVPNPGFTNDVAADAEGRVYLADTGTSTIWRLDGDTFEPWLVSKDLNAPNGLYVKGDKIIVAAWGVMAEGDKPGVPAGLLEVSIADKQVRPLGDGTPVGNLDGIEPLNATSYLVTDWVAGGLYRIDSSGKAELLLDLDQGSADIGYIAGTGTVLIPMMKDGKLLAYKVE